MGRRIEWVLWKQYNFKIHTKLRLCTIDVPLIGRSKVLVNNIVHISDVQHTTDMYNYTFSSV